MTYIVPVDLVLSSGHMTGRYRLTIDVISDYGETIAVLIDDPCQGGRQVHTGCVARLVVCELAQHAIRVPYLAHHAIRIVLICIGPSIRVGERCDAVLGVKRKRNPTPETIDNCGKPILLVVLHDHGSATAVSNLKKEPGRPVGPRFVSCGLVVPANDIAAAIDVTDQTIGDVNIAYKVGPALYEKIDLPVRPMSQRDRHGAGAVIGDRALEIAAP